MLTHVTWEEGDESQIGNQPEKASNDFRIERNAHQKLPARKEAVKPSDRPKTLPKANVKKIAPESTSQEIV